MERQQILEDDLLSELIRIVVIDCLDAEQGEVTLIFFRRANLAADDRSGAKSEAANLAGRDVDVVGAGQVVVIGAAQEAEAVGEDFKRSLAVHQAVLFDALLKDLEDQVLLLQAGDFGESFIFGDFLQLRERLLLKLRDVGVAAFDFLVATVCLFIKAAGAAGIVGTRRTALNWRANAGVRRRARRWRRGRVGRIHGFRRGHRCLCRRVRLSRFRTRLSVHFGFCWCALLGRGLRRWSWLGVRFRSGRRGSGRFIEDARAK